MMSPMKTTLLVLTAVVMMAGAVLAEGEEWMEGFEKKVYEKDGKKLPYRITTVGEAETMPLLVFLHGAGERGDDNEAQLKHGMKDLVAWCEEEKQACRIFAPQCAKSPYWANLNAGYKDPDEIMMQPNPSWPMALVLEMIDVLVKEEGVDPKRIYVTGLSMGGYGTFDAVCRRPKFFAAAMPICGGGEPGQAEKIKDVPFWVFHGAKDGVVPPEMSRSIVAAIKAAGGKPKYREYPEAQHNSWSATYSDPKVWEWLFAQKQEGE